MAGGVAPFPVGGGVAPFKDSVEIMDYSPLGTQWTITTPLPAKRVDFSGITLNNVFYVMAGWNGQEFLKTVMAWDPDSRTWREEGSLATGRQQAGIGAISSRSATELCNQEVVLRDGFSTSSVTGQLLKSVRAPLMTL